MSSPATFNSFTLLPLEIRRQIYNHAIPKITTIKILEDEFEIPSISPPPALLTTTHESRAVALGWGLKQYPINTTVDWEDIYLSPTEATTLQLIISPPKKPSSKNLNITWTELQTVLGEALTDAKDIHIVCSQPQRLARLFMLPEAELVGVGESCIETGLWGKDVVASDREAREALHGEVLVTTSKWTVEEMEEGQGSSFDVWRTREEEAVEGFGETGRVFKTRGFERVEVEQGAAWRSVGELNDLAERSRLGQEEDDREVEEVPAGDEEKVEGEGDELTAEAVERHIAEMARLHPELAEQGSKIDPGGSISIYD